MSDGLTPIKEGFIRYKKVRGKHRMYCPVREKKVVLGKGCEDGDVAYLGPGKLPKEANESWKRLDGETHVAEATEQEIQEQAGEPEGTLEITEIGEESYNVVNTATKEAINTAPLTRDQAEAIVAGSPVAEVEKAEEKSLLTKAKEKLLGKGKDDEVQTPECPLEGVKFGIEHDEYEECDTCEHAEACKAASKKVEDEG